jgi:hypothetical protein
VEQRAGDLSDRLRKCIDVEETCSRVYEVLAALFEADTEARDFWRTLSLEEREHAYIISYGMMFHRMGRLPEDFVCELSKIGQSIAFAEKLHSRAHSGTLGLEEALRLAFELEQSTAEVYFFETFKRKTDNEVLEKLRRMHSAEKTHMEMLREFMKARGYAEQG